MTFRAPDFDAPVDLENHLACQDPKWTVKGFHFSDLASRYEKARLGVASELYAKAGIPVKRYVAFFEYPHTDFIKLAYAAAGLLHPHRPRGHALREVGKGAYEVFFSNQIGKIVFGVFGKDFGGVARAGAKGWGVALSFADVKLEDLGRNHIRYHFRNMPAFLETMQVGVIEGAMALCETEGEVLVDLKDIANATLDLTWV